MTYLNYLSIIIIGCFIYFYLYPRYKNIELIKKEKEKREHEIVNYLYKIYQEQHGIKPDEKSDEKSDENQTIIILPEDNYYNEQQRPSLPKELIEKNKDKKINLESRYFENTDPLREVAIYSDFILRNGEYPPSNNNDMSYSQII